jgi:hypothetical protein
MARAQVKLTASALRSNEDLAPLVREGSLAVVGAYYSLDTDEAGLESMGGSGEEEAQEMPLSGPGPGPGVPFVSSCCASQRGQGGGSDPEGVPRGHRPRGLDRDGSGDGGRLT